MIQEILSNLTYVTILTFICSFGLVYYMIPKIIFMVNYHELSEEPCERSSHKSRVPTMGGLSFFITLLLAIFFFQFFDTEDIGLNIVAALAVIFVIGLKDDLAATSPKARIFNEIIAVSIILFHHTMHISSFDGFLGIYGISSIAIDILMIVMTLTIINAYNLIDGVDGLASTIGMVIFSLYGLIFFTLGMHFYFLICLSLIGILIAYMRYNFSHKNKIFMGDTGSLIIGFCIALLSLKFFTLDATVLSNYSILPENKLIVIAAIISVPLCDMFRVIGVRLLQGESPFKADRNHIHHILLDLGFPHYKIALILGLLNYFLAVGLIYLSTFLNSFQMLGVMLLMTLVFLGSFFILKRKVRLKKV